MVDGSVWSVDDKGLVDGEFADEGVNLTGLEDFVWGEGR